MSSLATYTFGDALLTMLGIFLLVAWLWVLFTIITDLFRDHQLSGWAKAAWLVALIFLPVVTALVYVIARGSGMRERLIAEQVESRRQMDAYIRETAGSAPTGTGSSVDELSRLADLRERGAISDEEYDRLKAGIVMGTGTATPADRERFARTEPLA